MAFMFWLAILVFVAASWVFLRWNGSIGPRYHAHEELWRPARTVDESGLSPFQKLAELRIRDRLAVNGFQLTDRVKHSSFVQATIEGTTLNIWIYIDGGSIAAPTVDRRFEDWDAETPEKLADDFAATAAELALKYRSHTA